MAKNKSRKWLWIILAIILLGSIGIYYSTKNKEDEGIKVEIDQIAKRDILETVTASGKVFPETEVKMSSDVSGEIVDLYVSEGDTVRAGQVLAKIDPDTYLSAVERGKATLNNAKAQQSMAQANIESSRAQKEQIRAQIANAKTIHDRNTTLYNDGVISQVEYEQSDATLKGLQANLRASEAGLKSSEKSAEGASYNVKSTEATLRELKTSLSRTTIKAPVDGIVSSLTVEQGERVDAYPESTFQGVVTHVSNSASNISTGLGSSLSTDQVTNFLVEVRVSPESYADLLVPGRPHPFRPGMSATVDIFTDIAEDIIAVPIQAVTTRVPEEYKDKTKKVYEEVIFAMKGDSAVVYKVTTGIQDDEYIQLTSDIPDDLTIITGPYNAVSDELEQGEKVQEEKEKEDDNKKKKWGRG